ncbi:hypothetical protein B0I37DRAFT_1544 [Chaetomium sp. MPI-CAGE-AT-0009]|nr:hypothetical protein B0I37DRAFT_1544 [Chaetomium sp. MPI-CAGE-AT-0009]
MVSLRSLVTGAVALMAATVNAALTPQQIADGMNSITEKARALQAPAERLGLSLANVGLDDVGQGPFPELIEGFTDITRTGRNLAAELERTSPIHRGDRGSIAELEALEEMIYAIQHPIQTLHDVAWHIVGEPVTNLMVYKIMHAETESEVLDIAKRLYELITLTIQELASLSGR